MAREIKKITFQLPDVEYERLESFCDSTGRSKTDVLRELIRSLPEPKQEQAKEDGNS